MAVTFEVAAAPAATGSTGVTLTPYTAVGILNLDGNGNFTASVYQYASTGTQTLAGNGTYTVGANCTLNLSFAKPAAGSTGAITPPAAFSVLLGTATGTNATNGLVSLQPTSGQVISGVVISQ